MPAGDGLEYLWGKVMFLKHALKIYFKKTDQKWWTRTQQATLRDTWKKVWN